MYYSDKLESDKLEGNRTLIADAVKNPGQKIQICGWVHRIRDLGGVRFIILRDRSGQMQMVSDSEFSLPVESVIKASGKVVENPKAPCGTELILESYDILSRADTNLPVPVNQNIDSLGLDIILDHRMISLRNPKILSIFRVQATCVQAFADFFRIRDFTEIKTSKIISGGSEGGTNLFPMDYFGKPAYMAQSPQLYKQTMISAGFERVFEIGHAYRAEKHETPRHINEYVSLDIEMAFIESEQPLMQIQRELMAYLIEEVMKKNQDDLRVWNADLPDPDLCAKAPVVAHDKARDIVRHRTGVRAMEINPEAERVLCEWAQEEYGISMVLINEFPRRKRPFYTYPSGQKTMSFDLLFRGLEMTTGGRRINDYAMMLDAIRKFGIKESSLGNYLDIFKYGCPPHGGFAMGLERITQKFLGLKNIKEATLFPRDRKRLTP